MSITKGVFSSSAFQVAINLVQRLIGIVSTLILARLLTPDDFGIIAILALTIHLTDILSDAGSKQYIIQKQNTEDSDLNTAWTIDIIGKFTLTGIIWLIAPTIATSLNNPLLTDAIRVVSLCIPIRAMHNPALILLAKEFDYKRLFKLGVWQKLLSFSVVMIVVAIQPSYWAIVAGDIVSAMVLLVGSYQIHSYRPGLSLAHLKEQWAFSQWSLLRGITGYARSQADILIVSKLFPPAALGGYHLQRELALTPAFSLVIPAIEPLLSAIAKAKYDAQLLAYRLRLSMVTLLALLVPLSIFIFFSSELIVAVLLGDQWLQYHELLAYFSLMFFAFCFHALISDCFTAINRMRLLFYFDLLSTFAIVAILLAFIDLDIHLFALVRGVAGLFITISLLLLLNTVTQLNILRLLVNLLPACLAAVLSTFITQAATQLLPVHTWALITLVFKTLVFFAAYLVLLLVLIKILRATFTTRESYLEEIAQLSGNIDHLMTTIRQKLRPKTATEDK